jgi:hypothetical protein
MSSEEITSRLEALREAIPPVIAALDAEWLAAPYPEPYRGAVLSTRQFLVHLLAHLDYHLGQIDYLRRVVTGSSARRSSCRAAAN